MHAHDTQGATRASIANLHQAVGMVQQPGRTDVAKSKARDRLLAALEFDGAMVQVPGGSFVMGDDEGDPNETPRPATVGTFLLMRLEVTNRQFSDFVAVAGYRTDAERSGSGYVWDRTWERVPGADWRHPNGSGSSIDGKTDHPVVQVSAHDAAAFCAWHDLRLPSEAEWEFAARGAEGHRYPWGMSPPGTETGRRANFGTVACCAPDAADGYRRTAPVGRFSLGASPFGILDMAGNVWEWTASRFPGQPQWVVLRGGGWGNNPYCLRTAYRHGNPPEIGLDMVGFRCAGDLNP
jgi:formylglycine-generating enzyme required for sulfatase activity